MEIRLLVVEEDKSRWAGIKDFFAGKIGEDKAMFDFAATFVEAKGKLCSNTYKGVISDVFLPRESDESDIRILRAMVNADLFEDEIPYGILIGKYALMNGMAVMFIKDSYHRGGTAEICRKDDVGEFIKRIK
jgi:hypothetical protein